MGFIGRYRSILRDRVNLYHRDLEPVAPGLVGAVQRYRELGIYHTRS